VLQTIKNYFTPTRIQQLTDVRNIGLYIFAIIVLAITWSGVKTVQNNYELQKKISTIKQQNSVLSLQNANAFLKNEYLNTNQYLELAARQDFGLASPGEKVLLVPKAVANKYIDPTLASTTTVSLATNKETQSKFVKNLEDWRDFLLGRKLFSD
jgi:cell division protein FtsB